MSGAQAHALQTLRAEVNRNQFANGWIAERTRENAEKLSPKKFALDSLCPTPFGKVAS